MSEPTTIQIEGVSLPIKPTPAAKLWPALKTLTKSWTEWGEDEWSAFIDALWYGIKRAEGQVAKEWLSMNVDLNNLEHVMSVFSSVNGLRGKEGGSSSGEAVTAIGANGQTPAPM
jgi:hypothetical protein